MSVLLWTERPVLIERELETHAWMELNRPWEKFELELIHDREPGDWRHYSQVFHQAWKRAHDLRTSLINLESDIVPTELAFRQVLECREDVCMAPYEIYGYNDGIKVGHSATVEVKVRGGWDAHLAREGDLWAEYGDLGFVRFGPAATGLNIDEVGELPADNGLLNELVYAWLRKKIRRVQLVHLHWPALHNNHVFWDLGDDSHHPPAQRRLKPGTTVLRPPPLA